MEAELERDGSTYTLLVERRLAHSPQEVWRFFIERERLKEWFPCDVEGAWEVGSALQFTFLQGEGEGLSEEDMQGEVLAIDEPRLLEFRWGTHLLKFELTPDEGGCRFRLSHNFGERSWGARNAAGWEVCLDNLDLLLDGAAALGFAAKVWRGRFNQYVAKFEPTFGLQDGPPEDHPLLAEEAEGPAA